MRRGDRFDFEICRNVAKISYRPRRIFGVYSIHCTSFRGDNSVARFPRCKCETRVYVARDFAKSPSDRRARSEKSSRATRMTQYCALMRFRERDRPGGASIVSGAYLIARDILRLNHADSRITQVADKRSSTGQLRETQLIRGRRSGDVTRG